MIDSIQFFKQRENKTIIFNQKKEFEISNNVFNSKSKKLAGLIKTQLGNHVSLLNGEIITSILFELTNGNDNPITSLEIDRINAITYSHKCINRVKEIIDSGYNIKFHSFQDKTFKLNLEMIDSDLPKIIAEMVLAKNRDKTTKIVDVIESLRNKNPLNYDLSKGHKFYEYRIVNFLTEAALGMTSKTVWSGECQVIGGILIVKPNAEILCYHLIDFNKFRSYLIRECKLDNPSGSKMGYGSLFLEEGRSFIKLNFQVKA